MTPEPAHAIQVVDEVEAAADLMDPFRLRILAELVEPASASDVGAQLDDSRQKVNYHIKELVKAGLVEPAGTRPARGVDEKLYQATARAYLVAPRVLGPLAPDPEATDADGSDRLLAATARTQDTLAALRDKDPDPMAFTLETTVRLAEDQQAAFTDALEEAIAGVVDRFSATDSGDEREIRVLVGGHEDTER